MTAPVALTDYQISCIKFCGCDRELLESGDVRCMCVIEVDERDVQHSVCGALACVCHQPVSVAPKAVR